MTTPSFKTNARDFFEFAVCFIRAQNDSALFCSATDALVELVARHRVAPMQTFHKTHLGVPWADEFDFTGDGQADVVRIGDCPIPCPNPQPDLASDPIPWDWVCGQLDVDQEESESDQAEAG